MEQDILNAVGNCIKKNGLKSSNKDNCIVISVNDSKELHVVYDDDHSQVVVKEKGKIIASTMKIHDIKTFKQLLSLFVATHCK